MSLFPQRNYSIKRILPIIFLNGGVDKVKKAGEPNIQKDHTVITPSTKSDSHL